MGTKNILRIKSTGELCVDEGHNISGNGSGIEISTHVRIIEDETYNLTGNTKDVHPDDLAIYGKWNGSEYIFYE